MKPLLSPSLPRTLALLVVAASAGCADKDGTNANAAGNSGAVPASSGGTSGAAVNVVPDELKDCGSAGSADVPALKLSELVRGLTRPLVATQARGDDSRLFVVEKPGKIRIVHPGAGGAAGELLSAPFLDLTDRVSERSGAAAEMGLLGLAFHPDYAKNGRFYVYYSTLIGGAHNGRLSEFKVSSASADQGDVASERVLFEVPEPQDNHNGGNIVFGRDGYLYLGLGDGGGGGDQHGANGNGQNLQSLLGKMLRFDIDGTGSGAKGQYAVPAGNMTAEGALPELWSYGLRNPWRYSFDACTGAMYIGDVGQDKIEEVDFEPAGVSGRNYGWRLMEADSCFNPGSGCNADSQGIIPPIASYDHGVGQSITGGYVYRGSAIPLLRGTYLYADYNSAKFFALRVDGTSVSLAQQDITSNINPGSAVKQIASFGEGNHGELYVLSLAGTIYRVDAK
jgi:glucose/arabinose dehydrogenase